MSDAVARTRWPRRLGRSRNVVTGALIVTLVVLAALFAGAISTHNPRRLDPANRLKPPSAQNYLGTDEFGRDVWSLVVHGSQVSLLVGATTMALTSLGGIVVGLVAGYYRRLDLGSCGSWTVSWPFRRSSWRSRSWRRAAPASGT